MASENATAIGGAVIVSTLSLMVGGALYGWYQWNQHRDRIERRYAAGSVCDHEFKRNNIALKSAAMSRLKNSDGRSGNGDELSNHDSTMSDIATEFNAAQVEEFTDIVVGLRAANAAIVKRGDKPLICVPHDSESGELALYNAYWNGVAERKKKDPKVCARDYSGDILVYLAGAAFRCGA